MRKALLLSLGVAAAFAGAVFVGAAAATTGAPVFYDARYPQAASTAPEGYEVGEAGGIRSQRRRHGRRGRRRRRAPADARDAASVDAARHRAADG